MGVHPHLQEKLVLGDKLGELFRFMHLPFVTTNARTFQNPVSPEISSEGITNLVQLLSRGACSRRRSLDLITSHLQHWQGLPALLAVVLDGWSDR